MVDPSRKDARARFWDRYIQALRKQGVKPPFDRWHVRRAEEFIKAHPDQRLRELGPDAVQSYLRRKGHAGNLKAWQFQQVVRAIQTLYSTANTAWAARFDWQYWMDAARTLEPEHVSTARDTPAPTPVRLAERVADTRLAHVVHAHPALLRLFLKQSPAEAWRSAPRKPTWRGPAGSLCFCSRSPWKARTRRMFNNFSVSWSHSAM